MRRCFGWSIHYIRGDATNSTIALSWKAHNCEVLSDFHYRSIDGLQPPQPCVAMYSDVQKVPLNCGSIEQRAMYLKQCKSMGMQTWEERDSESDSDSDGQAAQRVSERYFHLRIYAVGSDQGGDQRGSHKLMLSDCAGRLKVWYWRHWCMRHVGHLVVEKGSWSGMATPSGAHLQRQ